MISLWRELSRRDGRRWRKCRRRSVNSMPFGGEWRSAEASNPSPIRKSRMRSGRAGVDRAFVVDSSVAIAWTVAWRSSEQTYHLLDRVSSGASFVVPSLWMFEIANSLLVLARRQRIHPDEFIV